MGSLTSRPNIPQVQQPVYSPVPQYTAPPVTTVTTTAPAQTQTPATTVTTSTAADTATTDASSESTTSEEATRLAREDSLLRRSRGLIGTVLTGLSGLLSQTVASAPRKTLLGE